MYECMYVLSIVPNLSTELLHNSLMTSIWIILGQINTCSIINEVHSNFIHQDASNEVKNMILPFIPGLLQQYSVNLRSQLR